MLQLMTNGNIISINFHEDVTGKLSTRDFTSSIITIHTLRSQGTTKSVLATDFTNFKVITDNVNLNGINQFLIINTSNAYIMSACITQSGDRDSESESSDYVFHFFISLSDFIYQPYKTYYSIC